MGKLLSYEGYTARDAALDCCGRHAAIADVFDAAIDLDDAALAEYDLDTLQEALDALAFCEKYGCKRHYGCRAASDALSQAWDREQARLAELDEQEADAQGSSCCNSMCAQCVGDIR